MQTKYHSKKAYYKTEVFDSKKERDRYVQLCLLEKAGEINPEGKTSAREDHAKAKLEKQA